MSHSRILARTAIPGGPGTGCRLSATNFTRSGAGWWVRRGATSVTGVVTLIHLNGPAGVGKSTLAQRYVDEHHGVLNLDIDRVVAMLGRWDDDFGAALAPARNLAIAMAETHLRTGFNVVMPQLVTSHDEAARFEAAAERAGATYLEVALLIDPIEQITRFHAKSTRSSVDQHIERDMDAKGGDAILRRIHSHFAEYLEGRPLALHVDTRGQHVEVAYGAILSILG